jgi:hypothetical protein
VLTVLVQAQGAGFIFQARTAHSAQVICVGCRETTEPPSALAQTRIPGRPPRASCVALTLPLLRQARPRQPWAAQCEATHSPHPAVAERGHIVKGLPFPSHRLYVP